MIIQLGKVRFFSLFKNYVIFTLPITGLELWTSGVGGDRFTIVPQPRPFISDPFVSFN